jgi:hypothetical protein
MKEDGPAEVDRLRLIKEAGLFNLDMESRAIALFSCPGRVNDRWDHGVAEETGESVYSRAGSQLEEYNTVLAEVAAVGLRLQVPDWVQ